MAAKVDDLLLTLVQGYALKGTDVQYRSIIDILHVNLHRRFTELNAITGTYRQSGFACCVIINGIND